MPAETHVTLGPLGPDDIVAMVRELVADVADLDDAAVTLDTELPSWPAVAELADALEDELGDRTVGFRFDDDLFELRTVRDVVEYVLARLGDRDG